MCYHQSMMPMISPFGVNGSGESTNIGQVALGEHHASLLHAILLPNPMHTPQTTTAHQTITTPGLATMTARC